MIRYIYCLFVAIFTIACSHYPADVEQALELAGNNCAELEQVLEHYRTQPEDSVKYKATCFLVANMWNHGWYAENEAHQYQHLFDRIAHICQSGRIAHLKSTWIQKQWDSITHIYDAPSFAKATFFSDLEHISADYLIKSIDRSFMLWDSLSWCKDLDKNLFFEFVLPYRIGVESPENWKQYGYERTQMIRDTLLRADRRSLAVVINQYASGTVFNNNTLWGYPFDFTIAQLEQLGLGSCEHRVRYTAKLMRANGLPVAVDYIFCWGTRRGGHHWNVLMDKDGNYPFDGATLPFVFSKFDRKIAKAFREIFSTKPVKAEVARDIPDYLINLNDVTNEYTKTYDISVDLYQSVPKHKNYALIGSFNNQSWQTQYWGRIENGKATFEQMGAEIVYIPLYYANGKTVIAGDPFLLETTGELRYFTPNPDIRNDMTLLRKYPLLGRTKAMMAYMIGSKFVASNRSDCSDTTTLYTVKIRPEKFETVVIHDKRKFRYLRYLSQRENQERIAELEFYGLSDDGKDTVLLTGKIIGYPNDPANETPYTNVFDGRTNNFFHANGISDAWVGMDFGEPKQIVKIRYCPSSDTNFIEPRHLYELCYWHKGIWISVGTQVAATQKLIFKSVPSNALYILHDHTKGNEERIFTYENGEQVWW